MRVGKSVSKAIDEWQQGDQESAMLHACNAVDGTANKQDLLPKGNKARFLKLLRDNYDILGPMGMPGVDLQTRKWNVRVEEGAELKSLELAEVIYVVHRCAHGHGDELPGGFELLLDAGGPTRHTRFTVGEDRLQLSDRIIFGLIAVAVANPKNAAEVATDGHYLTFDGGPQLPINDWWGRRDDFAKLMTTMEKPKVLWRLYPGNPFTQFS